MNHPFSWEWFTLSHLYIYGDDWGMVNMIVLATWFNDGLCMMESYGRYGRSAASDSLKHRGDHLNDIKLMMIINLGKLSPNGPTIQISELL